MTSLGSVKGPTAGIALAVAGGLLLVGVLLGERSLAPPARSFPPLTGPAVPYQVQPAPART